MAMKKKSSKGAKKGAKGGGPKKSAKRSLAGMTHGRGDGPRAKKRK